MVCGGLYSPSGLKDSLLPRKIVYGFQMIHSDNRKAYAVLMYPFKDNINTSYLQLVLITKKAFKTYCPWTSVLCLSIRWPSSVHISNIIPCSSAVLPSSYRAWSQFTAQNKQIKQNPKYWAQEIRNFLAEFSY